MLKTRWRLVLLLHEGGGAGSDEGDKGEREGVREDGVEQEERVEIAAGEEGRELSWWGVHDGDGVAVEPW